MSKLLSILLPMLLLSGALHAAGPDVPLRDFGGKDRNVNEFTGKGKWVIVTVWAHDCHVCNQEIHEMVAFHEARKDRDAIVLGVTVDGWERKDLAREFVEKHKLNFDNLIVEPEQEIVMRFGGGPFVGTPTYYVYEPEGVLVARNIGAVNKADIDRFIDNYKPQG